LQSANGDLLTVASLLSHLEQAVADLQVDYTGLKLKCCPRRPLAGQLAKTDTFRTIPVQFST
jgi:hypothetical protein